MPNGNRLIEESLIYLQKVSMLAMNACISGSLRQLIRQRQSTHIDCNNRDKHKDSQSCKEYAPHPVTHNITRIIYVCYIHHFDIPFTFSGIMIQHTKQANMPAPHARLPSTQRTLIRVGSTLRYSAMPPHTPPITRFVLLLYNFLIVFLILFGNEFHKFTRFPHLVRK